MQKKKIILAHLLMLAFLACDNAKNKKAAAHQQEESVRTHNDVEIIRYKDLSLLTVNNTQITNYVPITGRVIPEYSIQLAAEVPGKILPGYKTFKAGTAFLKGELLLRIDSREFSLNLEAQKSSFLNTLTAMMPDLKADYPANYENWKNYVSSYHTGKPLNPLPAPKSDSENYFLTSRQIYNSYYQIKAQEERLQKYSIRAPFNGVVTQALVDVGGLVSTGQSLGSFISNRDFEVEAAVDVKTANQLKIGQQIALNNTDTGENYTAKIARINSVVDNNTQNIAVYLQLEGRNIKFGSYLQGRVAENSYASAFTIPVEILARDNTVLILKDSVIAQRKLQVLASTRDSLIVSGFTQGDQLILNEFETPVSGLKISK